MITTIDTVVPAELTAIGVEFAPEATATLFTIIVAPVAEDVGRIDTDVEPDARVAL